MGWLGRPIAIARADKLMRRRWASHLSICPKAVALLALKNGIKGWFHDVTVPLGGLQ
jgi:hypothetical protein